MLRSPNVTRPLARILLVEDDRPLVYFVRSLLERDGYRVIEASDGAMGLDLALKERPDLLVLDVDMPRLSGIAVCQELRRLQFNAPILLLTGGTRIDQKVAGLDAGADDYLAKPFEPREFIARVQALLRRQKRESLQHLAINLGDVHIDLAKKTAIRDGKSLSLTKTEYALIELLARNMDQPVSRETILDIVWGYTRFPNTRTVDTHIWRMRKKLGPRAEKNIQPVYGSGYRLTLSAATAQGAGSNHPHPHVA